MKLKIYLVLIICALTGKKVVRVYKFNVHRDKRKMKNMSLRKSLFCIVLIPFCNLSSANAQAPDPTTVCSNTTVHPTAASTVTTKITASRAAHSPAPECPQTTACDTTPPPKHYVGKTVLNYKMTKVGKQSKDFSVSLGLLFNYITGVNTKAQWETTNTSETSITDQRGGDQFFIDCGWTWAVIRYDLETIKTEIHLNESRVLTEVQPSLSDYTWNRKTHKLDYCQGIVALTGNEIPDPEPVLPCDAVL